MNENQIKADAINNFVSTMIGAFESGFVDKNNPTLSEIHQVARNHVKDNYDIELPNIVEQWGENVANDCGKDQVASYLICDTDEGTYEAKDNGSLGQTKLLRDELEIKDPSISFSIYAELDV